MPEERKIVVTRGLPRVVNLRNAQGASGVSTVEGTSVLSTGEAGGTKFLREDGDGTCSWQPAGAGDLLAANNLSDVASVSTARDNLGLGSAQAVTHQVLTADGGVNIGAVTMHNTTAQILDLGGGLDTGTAGGFGGNVRIRDNGELHVYSDLDDPDGNFERLKIVGDTSGNFTISTEGDGAVGADGDLTLAPGSGTVDINGASISDIHDLNFGTAGGDAQIDAGARQLHLDSAQTRLYVSGSLIASAQPAKWMPGTVGSTKLGNFNQPWGELHMMPGGTATTPTVNGGVTFELTNDTTFTVIAKGSDGTVRSGTITLA